MPLFAVLALAGCAADTTPAPSSTPVATATEMAFSMKASIAAISDADDAAGAADAVLALPVDKFESASSVMDAANAFREALGAHLSSVKSQDFERELLKVTLDAADDMSVSGARTAFAQLQDIAKQVRESE